MTRLKENNRFQVRFNSNEAMQLRFYASELNKPVSTLIRDCVKEYLFAILWKHKGNAALYAAARDAVGERHASTI